MEIFPQAEKNGTEKPAAKIAAEVLQSSREYKASPIVEALLHGDKTIVQKPISLETKVCLMGDGQGMDTRQFVEMGVRPEYIRSVNYDRAEIRKANEDVLKRTGVEMTFADATDLESLHLAGIADGSQDVAVLMHVLETPTFRGKTEQRLVENIARILSADGEALLSQYKKKLSPEDAAAIGVERIDPDSLKRQYGESWREEFRQAFGTEWYEGMRYSEISHIRTAEELRELFSASFDVNVEETDDSFVLRLKKKGMPEEAGVRVSK